MRRTFPGASTCLGVTSPPPLDALRTFNLPQFAYAKRSCNLFWPASARGEEVLLISSRLHSLTARRSFYLVLMPPIAWGRWGLKTLHWCLRSPDGDEDLKTLYLCLRSPDGDEDLKLYTLKLRTECTRSEFTVALNHARATRSLFRKLKNDKHANLMNLETLINFETFFVGWPR